MFLVLAAIVSPMGYSFDEVCSRCGGDGTVVCPDCYGSGVCESCGGDGVNQLGWWCAFCGGTGRCRTCDGSGHLRCGDCLGRGFLVHWMFNISGVIIYSSLTNIFLFLGIFILEIYGSVFYLSFNEWIYQVKHMDFLFNPSFMIWLFAKDRKRWAKWSMGYVYVFTVIMGTILFQLITLGKIPSEIYGIGVIVGIVIFSLFTYLFYLSYTTKLSTQN